MGKTALVTMDELLVSSHIKRNMMDNSTDISFERMMAFSLNPEKVVREMYKEIFSKDTFISYNGLRVWLKEYYPELQGESIMIWRFLLLVGKDMKETYCTCGTVVLISISDPRVKSKYGYKYTICPKCASHLNL